MADSKKQLADLRAMYESIPEGVQQKFLTQLASELKEKMPCHLRGTELDGNFHYTIQMCPECTTVVTSTTEGGDENMCSDCRCVWCVNHYDTNICVECEGRCNQCVLINSDIVCLDEECQAVLHCICYDEYHCPKCNTKYGYHDHDIWVIEEPLTKAAR